MPRRLPAVLATVSGLIYLASFVAPFEDGRVFGGAVTFVMGLMLCSRLPMVSW